MFDLLDFGGEFQDLHSAGGTYLPVSRARNSPQLCQTTGPAALSLERHITALRPNYLARKRNRSSIHTEFPKAALHAPT